MENFEEIQDQIKQIVSKVEGPIYIYHKSTKGISKWVSS